MGLKEIAANFFDMSFQTVEPKIQQQTKASKYIIIAHHFTQPCSSKGLTMITVVFSFIFIFCCPTLFYVKQKQYELLEIFGYDLWYDCDVRFVVWQILTTYYVWFICILPTFLFHYLVIWQLANRKVGTVEGREIEVTFVGLCCKLNTISKLKTEFRKIDYIL